ncbi:MAG: cupin domain-containing protein [Edaphobacter sp.]
MSIGTTELKAYKRAPSHESSTWYMNNLTTYLAEKKDTDGQFGLMEAVLVPGNEPPPHIHAREDELYYVLEGEFDVYAGKDAFKVKQGECVFLPRLIPHGFKIRSPKLRLLLIITPGGLEGAFRGMASPAERIDLPSGMQTYATADLSKAVQVFEEYGVRLLSPDEVPTELPLYPEPL